MRKELMTIGIVGGLLGALVGVAQARPSSPEGTIELQAMTESELEVSRSASLAEPGVSYGDEVSFATEVTGVSNRATVYITVVCMQGLEVVYQTSGSTDESFLLMDQGGDNLSWDGQAADCGAWLQHSVKKGKGSEITNLDTDFFSVG